MNHFLIFSQYTSLPGEARSSADRIYQIACNASKENIVKVHTSSFIHSDKRMRSEYAGEYSSTVKANLEFVLFKTYPYKKNISIGRMIASLQFIMYFVMSILMLPSKKRNKTVVYIALPSIGSLFVTLLAFTKAYKVILDYQDIWPEAFFLFLGKNQLTKVLYKLLIIIRFFLWPPFLSQFFNYRVYAVSERFQSVLRPIFGDKNIKIIPISPRINLVNPGNKLKSISFNPIHIIYVGSAGQSYDLKTIIKAISLSNERRMYSKSIVLDIFCDKSEFFQYQYSNALLPQFVKMHGTVDHESLYPFLDKASIGLNPIHSSSYASITNKMALYISSCLPCLSSKYSDEVSSILHSFGIASYDSGDIESASECISRILKMSEFELVSTLWRINRYAVQNLDSKINYSKIAYN